MIREDRLHVEAGLGLMPTNFIDYQAAISVGSANDMLQLQVQQQIEAVSSRLDTVLQEIASRIDDDTSIQDGLNATQAEVDAMLAYLQARLEANNQARAAASAATMLVLQSQFDEIETYATYTRNNSSLITTLICRTSHFQSLIVPFSLETD